MATNETAREVRAVAKWVRVSPRKAQVVAKLIRGRPVPEARTVLAFTDRAAAREVEKVLRSAVANAEYRARDGGAGVDVDELYVKYAVINEGPKLKRFTPAAMGRATPIIKRTSHVEIVVAERGAR